MRNALAWVLRGSALGTMAFIIFGPILNLVNGPIIAIFQNASDSIFRVNARIEMIDINIPEKWA